MSSWHGFVYYVVGSMVASVLIQLMWVGVKNEKKYFVGGKKEVLTEGISGNGLSYVLFWTLFYGIVHVYN